MMDLNHKARLTSRLDSDILHPMTWPSEQIIQGLLCRAYHHIFAAFAFVIVLCSSTLDDIRAGIWNRASIPSDRGNVLYITVSVYMTLHRGTPGVFAALFRRHISHINESIGFDTWYFIHTNRTVLAMSAAELNHTKPERFDVVIVGAGMSGINCAYRLKTKHPGISFIILESRDEIGGTWDLFRYPGVRSDSQTYTYGFAWHPWPFTKPIADGLEIREYLHDAVSKHRIRDHMRFCHTVSSADWRSQSQEWDLLADHERQPRRFIARWLIMGTGYLDYQSPTKPSIPGLDVFKGKSFIHSGSLVKAKFQAMWSTLNSGKLIFSIRAGTSPSSAARSPTYVAAAPNLNDVQKFVPYSLVMAWRWLYWLVQPYLIVLLAKHYPGVVRDSLAQEAAKELPSKIPIDPHFKPRYDPWRQRLCLDPNAEFYHALHRPNVTLITGNIARVTSSGVEMRQGDSVKADAIITATGHRMMLGGKIDIRVDGDRVTWGKKFAWNSAMIDGIPNMMFMLGYTNHSWTPGADDTAIYLGRLMSYMERIGAQTVVPRVPQAVAAAGIQKIWQLDATYVEEADERLPVCGNSGP
uniref:FAD-containing monooxygenase vniE n=1 Tax=Virgaria nigra TaxID=1085564 RepID=VNIE_VIRNI